MKNQMLMLGLVIAILSCNKADKNCVDYRPAYITSSSTPNSGNIGEPINIEISFVVNNSCGGFGNFIETNNGNTKTIEIEAKYTGCSCLMNIPTRKVNYFFTAYHSGTYYLRYKSGSSEFITDTLVIN